MPLLDVWMRIDVRNFYGRSPDAKESKGKEYKIQLQAGVREMQ